MAELFDDFCKKLAAPLGRRQAIWLAVRTAAASLMVMKSPRAMLAAAAGTPGVSPECNGLFNRTVCTSGNCPGPLCGQSGDTRLCCPSGQDSCGPPNGQCCCPEENPKCCVGGSGTNNVYKCFPSGYRCCFSGGTVYGCPPKTSCDGNGGCTAPMNSSVSVTPGPPAQARITLQDDDGISSITVPSHQNCSVVVPRFTPGTRAPITVVATQMNTSQTSQVDVQACSSDDPPNCQDVDPVAAKLSISTGSWLRQTFSDITPAEQSLTVYNGHFGLAALIVQVNSMPLESQKLGNGQRKVINMARLLSKTENTVTLTGLGEPGASAIIFIGPDAAEKSPANPPLGRPDASIRGSRVSYSWGRVPEEVEDTAGRHFAIVSTQPIQLVFSGVLDMVSVGAAGRFAVDVNGHNVAIESARFGGNFDSADIVLLQLRPGTLKPGDKVMVYWDDLRDLRGRTLSGHAGPITAQLVQ